MRGLFVASEMRMGLRQLLWQQRVRAFASGSVEAAPLARLEAARLSFPGAVSCTDPLDLIVHPPSAGGLALLGCNGGGKTLVARAIAHHDGESNDWVREGQLLRRTGWSPAATSSVSFESHEELLEEGGSVYQALCTRAHLSKAAKFLIVRFGLYQLLYRPITAISTGEIRKVLLARALASRPSLLVLDNAFDGLDVDARRKLADLISTTLRGFTPWSLVQGVDSSAVAHTQVLLITQRAEELVDEIRTVSFVNPRTVDGSRDTGAALGGLRTVARARGEPAAVLMTAALGANHDGSDAHACRAGALPTAAEVAAALGDGSSADTPADTPLVEARGLRVVRDEAVLLAGLDWTVRRGEHWLIAGGNGAGKSTLSKLLARADAEALGADGRLSVLGSRLHAARAPYSGGGVSGLPVREGISWVSTELHLSMSRSSLFAWQVLEGTGGKDAPLEHGQRAEQAAVHVARWLGLEETLLSRRFDELSQGGLTRRMSHARLPQTRPRPELTGCPCHRPVCRRAETSATRHGASEASSDPRA